MATRRIFVRTSLRPDKARRECGCIAGAAGLPAKGQSSSQKPIREQGGDQLVRDDVVALDVFGEDSHLVGLFVRR
jgi:hypothetical protein